MVKYIPGHLHGLGLGDTQEHLQVEGRADLQTPLPCSTSLQAHQEPFYPALPLTAASTPAHRIFLLYTSRKVVFSPQAPLRDWTDHEVHCEHDCSWRQLLPSSHLDKGKAKGGPSMASAFGLLLHFLGLLVFRDFPLRKAKQILTVSLPLVLLPRA